MEKENTDISKSQLPRIFTMMSLNSFGLGFISVFIPIYLMKLGYSFQTVMFWMALQHTTLLVMAFVVVFCSNRIGLVHCLHIRFILLISYLLLLFELPTYPILLFVISVLMGMESAFFWMPLNILFVRNTESETMGGSLSKFFTYPQFFSMWCPLIGAFIISFFGFKVLFAVALVFVFFAFVPLLPLRSEKTNFVFTAGSAKQIWSRNKKYFLPEVVDNIAEDTGVILTLFIFLKLLSITQIGIIGLMTSFVSIIFTLTIGKVSDRWDKHKLLKIGAILVSAVWVGSFLVGQFAPDKWLFYAITIALTLVMKTFLVPYQSMLFNSARKDDAQFIILREIPVVLGRVILYVSAALLFNYLPIVFLLVAIMFVYFWFLDTKKLVNFPEQV